MTRDNVYDALRSLGSTWWTLAQIAGRARFLTRLEADDRLVARHLGRLVAEGRVQRLETDGYKAWRVTR